MNEDNRLLLETAVLGEQVRLFIESDVGKYVLARAEESGKLATEKLKRASVWRKRYILGLQNEIRWSEGFREWLIEAIREGKEAQWQLETGGNEE